MKLLNSSEKNKTFFSENKISFRVYLTVVVFDRIHDIFHTQFAQLRLLFVQYRSETKARYWEMRLIRWMTKGAGTIPKEKNTRRRVKVSDIGLRCSLVLAI